MSVQWYVLFNWVARLPLWLLLSACVPCVTRERTVFHSIASHGRSRCYRRYNLFVAESIAPRKDEVFSRRTAAAAAADDDDDDERDDGLRRAEDEEIRQHIASNNVTHFIIGLG